MKEISARIVVGLSLFMSILAIVFINWLVFIIFEILMKNQITLNELKFDNNSNIGTIYFISSVLIFWIVLWAIIGFIKGTIFKVLYDINNIAFFFVFYWLLILLFATLYQQYGVEPISVNRPFFDYIYFSVSTMTTLGYGDITPTYESRFFTIIQSTIGFLIMPIFVALIFQILVEIRNSKSSILGFIFKGKKYI